MLNFIKRRITDLLVEGFRQRGLIPPSFIVEPGVHVTLYIHTDGPFRIEEGFAYVSSGASLTIEFVDTSKT
jgi:hypothetical protein